MKSRAPELLKSQASEKGLVTGYGVAHGACANCSGASHFRVNKVALSTQDSTRNLGWNSLKVLLHQLNVAQTLRHSTYID